MSFLTSSMPDSATQTILQAQSLLEEWTGQRPVHFAYPNGSYVR